MLPVGGGGLEAAANLEMGAPDTELDLKLFNGSGAGGTSGCGTGSGAVAIAGTSSVIVAVAAGGLSAVPSVTGGRGSCFVGDVSAGALGTPLGAGRV